MGQYIFVVLDFDNIECPVQGAFDSEEKAQEYVENMYGDGEPVQIQKLMLQ